MKHPDIKTKPVKSSQIAEIGYHDGTLCVKFKGGSCYHYHGVSADEFQSFQKAESMGSHLAKHIKNKFKFSKIGGVA